MTPIVPTGKDVLPYFEKLSNWGRWDLDDQHGTLNFLSQNKTLEAGLLVMEGTPLVLLRIQ